MVQVHGAARSSKSDQVWVQGSEGTQTQFRGYQANFDGLRKSNTQKHVHAQNRDECI